MLHEGLQTTNLILSSFKTFFEELKATALHSYLWDRRLAREICSKAIIKIWCVQMFKMPTLRNGVKQHETAGTKNLLLK